MITVTRYHPEIATSLRVEVAPSVTQSVTSVENVEPEIDVEVRYRDYRGGVVEQRHTFTIEVDVGITYENIFDTEFLDHVNQNIGDEIDIDHFATQTIVDAMARAYVKMVQRYVVYDGKCSLNMVVNVEIDEYSEVIQGVTMDMDEYNYYNDDNDNHDNNNNNVTENTGDEIRALMIRNGVKLSKVSSSGTQCAICLDAMMETESGGGQAARLPCSHVFHGDCVVDMVLRGSGLRLICPLCRFKVIDVHSS